MIKVELTENQIAVLSDVLLYYKNKVREEMEAYPFRSSASFGALKRFMNYQIETVEEIERKLY